MLEANGQELPLCADLKPTHQQRWWKKILSDLNICSLYVSRIKILAIEMYKILNDMSPSFLKDFFVINNVMSVLREHNVLLPPKHKTVTYGFKSLKYQGAKIWNDLPHTIKMSCSLNEFKRNINVWTGPQCKCGFCLLCTIDK